MKLHLKSKLQESQIISEDEKYYNENSKKMNLIRGIIASGLYPFVRPVQIARSREGRTFPFLLDFDGNRMYINQKSVNSKK